MSRKVLALILCVVLFCLSCVRTRTVLDEGGYQTLVDSVVVIKLASVGLCSGFFIDQTHIITNAHCVIHSPNQVYEVVTYRQYLSNNDLSESSYFVVDHVDAVRDLAIFEELFPNSIPYPINVPELHSGRYPRIGSDTIVVGHPAGQLFNITTGIVSRIGNTDTTTGITYLYSSAPIWYGNSGGPIFNQYGDVIGLARGIVRDQSFLGQFISYIEIRQFLDEVEEIRND